MYIIKDIIIYKQYQGSHIQILSFNFRQIRFVLGLWCAISLFGLFCNESKMNYLKQKYKVFELHDI